MDIVYALVSPVLTIVFLWFWKPWASAYAGEKGKNLARTEDLDKILSEVRAITIAQKEIEARLSGALWNQQMVWNQRRDAYVDVLRAIDRFQEWYGGLLERRIEGGSQLRSFTGDQVGQMFDDYSRSIGLIEIFGGKQTTSMIENLREALVLKGSDPIEGYDTALRRLKDARADVIKQAKTDLVRET